MTWTYTADPAASAKDAVRFLVGDTNEDATFTMQDEEILWNLAEVGNEPYRAAANSAENLAALYVGLATIEEKTVGGLEISRTYSDRAKRFAALANMLLIRSRRVNPPIPNAAHHALEPELKIGLLDPYYAVPTAWPNEAVTGVSTTYGTIEGEGEGVDISDDSDE
jgi:hypothetical protein